MRKAAIVFSALFWLIIIFFTFFGSTLYDITKPSVYAEFPTEMNGRLYLPKSAIFEENGGFYVYALSAETGFSREIYSVTRHAVSDIQPDDTGYFSGYVRVETYDRVGGAVVMKLTKPLYDGERVIREDWQ